MVKLVNVNSWVELVYVNSWVELVKVSCWAPGVVALVFEELCILNRFVLPYDIQFSKRCVRH